MRLTTSFEYKVFGGQSGTKEQVRYYKAFNKKHTGVVKQQTMWKVGALNTKKVTIPSGLTFYFPYTKLDKSGYQTDSTNICNYPIQSLATADIVPIGITYMWHMMKAAKMKSYMINTVHDCFVAEAHPDEIKDLVTLGELSMVELVYIYLDKVYGIDFNVPLEVEAELGTHWADSPYWQETYLHKQSESK